MSEEIDETPFFKSSVSINPYKFSLQPFHETHKVNLFSCGNKELDDFLTSHEVKEYEKQRFGKTTLVFYEGDLVAYYTLSGSALRIELLQTHKSFSKPHEFSLNSIPALMVGRFAVDKKWQGKGIGRELMKIIVGQCLYKQDSIATRLIIVEAKENAFDFYKKMGFEFTTETRRERGKQQVYGTRTMFFDLGSL